MLLAWIFGPSCLGALSLWFSGKCRGRNARKFFQYSAWGFWLLYLVVLPIDIIPGGIITLPINLILKLLPSAVMFLMAASSILKEMRAQRVGEYTDAA